MKANKMYLLGSIILFLGLLWMLLPHAYHQSITNEPLHSHLLDILGGLVVTIIGLVIMTKHSN